MKFIEVIEELAKFLVLKKISEFRIIALNYSENQFGNGFIEVEFRAIDLRILLDRGQSFLSIRDKGNTEFIDAEKKIPNLIDLQKTGKWKLMDQLELIKF